MMKITLLKNTAALLLSFCSFGIWSQSICDSLDVDFNWTMVGDDVYFTNLTSGEGAPTTYSWDYGSSSSSLENPVLPAQEGLIPVCLTVTTYYDSSTVCTGYYCDSIYYEADSTSSDPCDDLSASFTYYIDGGNIHFTNTSDGESTTSDYSWTYGSSSSSDENPVLPAEEGWIAACLTVVSYYDSTTACTDMFCDSIYYSADSTLGPPCDELEASFSYYVDGGFIYFTNTTSGEGDYSDYSWDYGSSSSSVENPTFPAEDGWVAACLTVVSYYDSVEICTSYDCDSIYYESEDSTSGPPCDDLDAGFTYYIDGGNVYFTNNSTGEGLSTDYSWDYGSSSSSLENPVLPAIDGWVSACLTVVSYYDSATVCTDYYCDSIFYSADTSSGPPCDELEASFTYTIDGGEVHFTNTTSGEGWISDYNWDYGSESSYDENPVMTAQDGWIPACLTVVTYFDSAVTCTSYYCDSIYFDADSSSASFDETEKKDALTLYPNPTEDILTISFSAENQNDQIAIYNAYGQIVYSGQLTKGVKQTSVSVNDLPPGLYILRLTDRSNPENRITERFIKK